jgi:hypothetical protein
MPSPRDPGRPVRFKVSDRALIPSAGGGGGGFGSVHHAGLGFVESGPVGPQHLLTGRPRVLE